MRSPVNSASSTANSSDARRGRSTTRVNAWRRKRSHCCHMAQTGPATLSELVVHLGRSPSTLSVKIAALEASGLLARQRDEQDARRALIWLSPAGRVALTEALDVLDVARLAEATKDWDAARRQHLVIEMQALVHALSQTSSLIPPRLENITHEPRLRKLRIGDRQRQLLHVLRRCERTVANLRRAIRAHGAMGAALEPAASRAEGREAHARLHDTNASLGRASARARGGR